MSYKQKSFDDQFFSRILDPIREYREGINFSRKFWEIFGHDKRRWLQACREAAKDSTLELPDCSFSSNQVFFQEVTEAHLAAIRCVRFFRDRLFEDSLKSFWDAACRFAVAAEAVSFSPERAFSLDANKKEELIKSLQFPFEGQKFNGDLSDDPDDFLRSAQEAVPENCSVYFSQVRSLVGFLNAGRRTVQSRIIHGALVDAQGGGSSICIRFERVLPGCGHFFPGPETLSYYRDKVFQEAEKSAWEYQKDSWPNDSDVVWTLFYTNHCQNENSYQQTILTGPSAGALFALGLRKVLTSDVNDHPVGVSATIMPEGKLGPVAGLESKLAAIIDSTRPDSFRADTFIVAKDQELTGSLQGFEPDPQQPLCLRHPHRNFMILKAENVDQANDLLKTYCRDKWYYDTLLPRNPDFVGRDNVFEYFDEFFKNNDEKYLLVTAEMGWGKSSMMNEYVHRLCNSALSGDGEAPIYCFVSTQGENNTTEWIAKCLYTQLQRKYLWKEDSNQSYVECLRRAFRRVSLEQRRQLVVVDGVDQIRKEPRNDYNQHPFENLFAELPSGIVGIFTRRSGCQKVLEPSCKHAELLNLDNLLKEEDCKDKKGYLKRQKCTVNLTKNLIDQIIESPKLSFFTLSRNIRNLKTTNLSSEERDRLLNDAEPWKRPPEDLIEEEVAKLCGKAERKGIEAKEVWQTLGFLALAGRPLDMDDLEEFTFFENENRRGILQDASFFFVDSDSKSPKVFEFAHPGYRDYILGKLKPSVTQKKVHRELAKKCALRRNYSGGASNYAYDYYFHHAVEAEWWEEVIKIILDLDFIEGWVKNWNDRCSGQASPPFDILFIETDKIIKKRPPEIWGKVFEAWERFLRKEIYLLCENPQFYQQSLKNNFIGENQRWFKTNGRQTQFTLPGLTKDKPSVNGEKRLSYFFIRLHKNGGNRGHQADIQTEKPEFTKACGPNTVYFYKDHLYVDERESKERLIDHPIRNDYCFHFHQDESKSTLAVAERGRGIWLFDLRLGRLIRRIRIDPNKFNQPVSEVRFFPDGKRLVTRHGDSSFFGIWHVCVEPGLKNEQQPKRIDMGIQIGGSVQFENNLLLLECEDGEIRELNPDLNPVQRVASPSNFDSGHVTAKSYLDDTKWKTNEPRQFHSLDRRFRAEIDASRETIRLFELNEKSEYEHIHDMEKNPTEMASRRLVSVAFSYCGRFLTAVDAESEGVNLWEVGTGKHLCRGEKHYQEVKLACFFKRSNLLISVGHDRQLVLWEIGCFHGEITLNPVNVLRFDRQLEEVIVDPKLSPDLFHLSSRCDLLCRDVEGGEYYYQFNERRLTLY